MASASEAEEIETDIECPAASDSDSKSSDWGGGGGGGGSAAASSSVGLPRQFSQGLPGTLRSQALKKPSESSSTESSADRQLQNHDGPSTPKAANAEPTSAPPEDPTTNPNTNQGKATPAEDVGQSSGSSDDEESSSGSTSDETSSEKTATESKASAHETSGKWDVPKSDQADDVTTTAKAQPELATLQQPPATANKLVRSNASASEDNPEAENDNEDEEDDDILDMFTRVNRKSESDHPEKPDPENPPATNGYMPSSSGQGKWPALSMEGRSFSGGELSFPALSTAEHIFDLDDLDLPDEQGLEAKTGDAGLGAKTGGAGLGAKMGGEVGSVFLSPTPTEQQQPQFPKLSPLPKPEPKVSVAESNFPPKVEVAAQKTEINQQQQKLPEPEAPPSNIEPKSPPPKSPEFDELLPSGDDESIIEEVEKEESEAQKSANSTVTRDFSSIGGHGKPENDDREDPVNLPENPVAAADRLPRFHTSDVPAEIQDPDRRQMLLSAAREALLRRREAELPTNGQLATAHRLLRQTSTSVSIAANDIMRARSRSGSGSVSSLDNLTAATCDDTYWLDWDEFAKLRTRLHPSLAAVISAQLFARLLQSDGDVQGRVSADAVFKCLMRHVWLRRTRLSLAVYDTAVTGWLTEHDLEAYIKDLIPTIPQLAAIPKSRHDFYVCTAVRRFMFFLDPKRLGRVRIVDILASGFLDDLFALKDQNATDEPTTTNNDSQDATLGPEKSVDDKSARSINLDVDQNWFSSDNAARVYYQYLNLDVDRNGMLSLDELKEYGGGTLTQPFLTRLFQECVTYRTEGEDATTTKNEMDFKSYLDFVLAMENKQDRAALEYFFRILDIRQRGYLDGFAFHFFFRAIYDNLLETAQHDDELVDFLDVKDEIFDMVRPADPHKITLQELIQSKQGETVVNILIDTEGFWRYDNREMLSTEDDEDDV